MSQVNLPSKLFEQIARSLPAGGSVDEFVREAIELKLAKLDGQRRADVAQAVDEFDAICDGTSLSVADVHLTRDQLHERD